jgi:hypothetical protein
MWLTCSGYVAQAAQNSWLDDARKDDEATPSTEIMNLMYVVIDDDAFEVGFKLQEQYNNRRLLWFHRNASKNTTQRPNTWWNAAKWLALALFGHWRCNKLGLD